MVASVCWIAFIVAIFASDTKGDPAAFAAGALLPPLVVYVLMFAVIPWIIAGFRGTK